MKPMTTVRPEEERRLEESGFADVHEVPQPMTRGERWRAERLREALQTKQFKLNRTVDPQNFEMTVDHANGVQLVMSQVARMFGVTNQSILNWRYKKQLPYYHLEGGVKPPVRYDEGMVLRWAELYFIPVMFRDYKDQRWAKSESTRARQI